MLFPIHDDTPRIHGRPYLNYGLIAINAIIFVWQAVVTGFFTNEQATRDLFLTYGTVPDLLFSNFPASSLNIVTSMFMHGGPAHIIGNMVFLFVFGDNLEDKFGRVKYILLYLGWGAAAALTHSFFAASTGDGMVPAVGASGAISGILGAYLVMFPRAKITTLVLVFFITPLRIPALAYIPFWFVLQVIFVLIGDTSGVAYLAHIGGFVAGIAVGFVGRAVVLPQLANLAGKGPTFKKPAVKKVRPKIEDVVPDSVPEVIEGPDYYEVIAEIRGVSDASEIEARYDPEKRAVVIITRGLKKYEMQAKLPDSAANPVVEYIQYLNGIARIRLTR